MNPGAINRLLGELRAEHSRRDLTDGELLARFCTTHEEAAFAFLVQRHGPMVLGVCRRILGNPHDADDAFQATFLVLVRKARSIRKRDSLANWLYGVARRIAARAAAQAAARQGRERQTCEVRCCEPVDAAVMNQDLRVVLDEEIERLPQKYRAAVVLCHLEGKTYEKAAAELGWPKSSLAGRLERARRLLHERLSRRGVTVPAGVSAGFLTAETLPASVPALLSLEAVRAAAVVISGKRTAASVVSQRASSLAEDALAGASAFKVKFVLVLTLLLATTASIAIGQFAATAREEAEVSTEPYAGRQPPEPKPAPRPARKAADAELHIVGVYGPKDLPRLGKIDVEVRKTPRPIVLVLTAYYSVEWNVKLDDGARLKEVIVSGYFAQEVRGVPAGVPVANRSWFPVDGSRRAGGFFWVYEGNTVEYREMVRKLNAATKLAVATFQGQYAGEHFIVDGTRGGRFAQKEIDPGRPASRELTPEEIRKAAAGAEMHVVSISRPAKRAEPVDIEIPPTPKPVALVLSSYYSAIWKPRIADKARVKLIIVGGADPQEIDGLAAGIPVVDRCERLSHFQFERGRFRWLSDFQWNSVRCRRMVEMLNGMTGLPLASFQGEDSGKMFVIDGQRGSERKQTEIKPRLAGKSLRPEELRTLVRGAELHVASVRAKDRATPVTVHVRHTPKPIVIALSSYQEVVWNLKLDDGARVTAVLLGGYYDQDIDGVPADVPLVRRHGFPLPDGCFWMSGPVEDEKDKTQYQDMVRKLNDMTGLPLATFQGEADATSIIIDGARGRGFAQKSLPAVAKTPRQPKAEDPLADVADVPAVDLRAEGDAKKRFFLIGKTAQAPPGGFRLLLVLPGGDGSADFNPFIRRIHKNVLNKDWLIAQLVAPRWDEAQFESVVWPTERLRYAAAKFTTEEFIKSVVTAVKVKAKLDPKRIYLLGWSSGGPPCYAAMAQKAAPLAGAFIAMSVFRADYLPARADLKSKSFYLLQSPDDRVTPIRFAEAAEKTLKGRGARVHLERYPGGHGWRGNVWDLLGSGVTWLEPR